MGPLGNLQGGVRFFSLKLGLILNWNSKDYQLLPILADVITRVHQMVKSLPRGMIFPNRKHIDDLDNKFNSHISDKGIPGVIDTNTNIDIKCKETTKSLKFNDDNKLHDLSDLEDIVRTVNDDDDDYDDEYGDMPELRSREDDDNDEVEEDYT